MDPGGVPEWHEAAEPPATLQEGLPPPPMMQPPPPPPVQQQPYGQVQQPPVQAPMQQPVQIPVQHPGQVPMQFGQPPEAEITRVDSPQEGTGTPVQAIIDGAASSFSELQRLTQRPPTGLRRTTSGIRGKTAPLWEQVEEELRQSTLTDFLRRMFDTLTQQQQALEKLNDVAMKNMRDIAELKEMQSMQQLRFAESQEVLNQNMADRLAKIEGDLGMQRDATQGIADDMRKMDEYGKSQLEEMGASLATGMMISNAEKKTLRQTVDELAAQHNKLCTVTRRGKYGRLKVTGWMLAELNLKAVCRRFFNKWMVWLRMGTDVRNAREGKESMAMLALTDTRREPLRRYFNKLKKFVDWARKQHHKADRYCKAIRRLNYSRSITTLAYFWGKLKRYLDMIAQEAEEHAKRNVQKAKMLEEISQQSLMKRYYNKLSGKRNIRIQFKKKAELCESLGKMCLNAISKRYFDKLSVYLMWRKYQRKRYAMAEQLEEKSNHLTMRRYLKELADGVALNRRILERIAISRALATKNAQVLRRDFYLLLSRYRVMRREQRDRDEQDNRFGEVIRKTDNLGTQIDVGLKTLSNTNSVLNKLVDRLIAVDQQLDTLEKDKVSRRELSFITDPVRHPSLLEDRPPSPPKMIHSDPRTSPPRGDPPIERYVPSVMTTERQRELERERERDQMLEMQQAAEMERKTDHLDRIASSMGAYPDRRSGTSPLSSLHANRPLHTPLHKPVTPSTDGGEDLAAQLKAQFEKELQNQQATYRSRLADLSLSERWQP